MSKGKLKLKTYTVFAIYKDNFQRYATSVKAKDPLNAEREAIKTTPMPIHIAGVIEGAHSCVDRDPVYEGG